MKVPPPRSGKQSGTESTSRLRGKGEEGTTQSPGRRARPPDHAQTKNKQSITKKHPRQSHQQNPYPLSRMPTTHRIPLLSSIHAPAFLAEHHRRRPAPRVK